ncbi:hypothetical protein [Nonomuraea sp. SYSU D8015]|uniref:hypothetical protein n=1 Tax=Nonomuraea sp. SYSU D8015 TaxID=2593644 RepID=UPI001660A6E9|nr:hypothetical protein [Nonomuraea sp. SYSU D8015]
MRTAPRAQASISGRAGRWTNGLQRCQACDLQEDERGHDARRPSADGRVPLAPVRAHGAKTAIMQPGTSTARTGSAVDRFPRRLRDQSYGGRAGQRLLSRLRPSLSRGPYRACAVLAALCLAFLLAGCASSAGTGPHAPASQAATATPFGQVIEPVSPAPFNTASRDTASRLDDAAVLATARAFVRAMLTYSYRQPEHLPPLNRVGTLITHGYTMRLQPRQSLDPELALTTREHSTVHVVSATIARQAPHDATTRYATIAYKQTLTQGGRRERVTRIWQIRLVRFPSSGWRVDDVTQAS